MNKKIKKIDNYFSEKYIDILKRTPYVQTILLHKIFRNRSEIIPENGDPLEAIDKKQFETFVKFFCKRKIQFIDETDILQGNLDPNNQYIYLTFDDGYFNNFFCLDILEKYKVKATFMISTNHIKYNKAFWWDVTYREIWKKNNKKSIHYVNTKIKEINNKLYNKKWIDQEEFITNHFGLDSLQAYNDLDRPMTESELRLFAKHPYVLLGNHTHNHINMTLYDENELIESIQLAEEFLKTVTSQNISSISYPHGWSNDNCINIIEQLGYEIGVTVNPGKNNPSEINNKNGLLRLNRIELSGHFDIEEQCRSIHTNFSLSSTFKNKIKR